MTAFAQELRNPQQLTAPVSRRKMRIAGSHLTFVATILVSILCAFLVLKMGQLKRPMTDSEVQSVIDKAWKEKKFDLPNLDEAIQAAADSKRDTSIEKRTELLSEAAAIRNAQGKLDEAKELLRKELRFLDAAGKPGTAIVELAMLESLHDLSAAIRMIEEQLAKDDAKGFGTSVQSLNTRFALAQLMEVSGRTADACYQYAQIGERGAAFQWKAIGLLGTADMYNELGNHQTAGAILTAWWRENHANELNWEFLPWALNIRAAAFSEGHPQQQMAVYKSAHDMVLADMEGQKLFFAGHVTALQRMWRAKAISELGIAKDFYRLRRFHEASQWMDAAVMTADDSGIPALDIIVKRKRQLFDEHR